MSITPSKEPGFTFLSNEPPYCEACISFAICNSILKASTYPKQALREIAENKCEPMFRYLVYSYQDKKLGYVTDISYRRICIILDTWEGVKY